MNPIQTNGKIEGVPDGWRLVAFRRPVKGEWFISAYTGEVLELTHGGPVCSAAIVVPDNVYGVRDPMKDVLAPHGFKAVAFRVPKDDEYWISPCGTVVAPNLYAYSDRTPRVIIEPLPPPPNPKRKVLIAEAEIGRGISESAALKRVDDYPLSRDGDSFWAYRIEERDA